MGSAPPIYQRSHTIKAALEIGAEPTEGVIVAEGGSAGGYALFVADGKLVYEYNFFDKNRYMVTSSGELPSGNIEVVINYEQWPVSKDDPAAGGDVTLLVNGKEVGSGKVERVVPARFSATETLDIGADLGSTASESYVAPHALSGKIKSVHIDSSSRRFHTLDNPAVDNQLQERTL